MTAAVLELNLPDVVAEVEAAFRRYEAALMANDVAQLNELFWRSPCTLRFGIAENLYGHEAIARYRRERAATDIGRRLENTAITTFGRELAVANTEFRRNVGGARGRQSQTWLRTEQGWRIVAAHVSLLPPQS